jgi:hypothetical protein
MYGVLYVLSSIYIFGFGWSALSGEDWPSSTGEEGTCIHRHNACTIVHQVYIDGRYDEVNWHGD